MKYNKEKVLSYLNEKAFMEKKYTKDEYMEELFKLQDAILDLYRDSENLTDETIEDLIYILQNKARENGVKDSEEVRNGINALKCLEATIAIECAGRKSEEKVNRIVDENKSEETATFRNISLQLGDNETEVDEVVLTPEGIKILEVKSVRGDVVIENDGRMFVSGRTNDYNPTGRKMKLQRDLLKSLMQIELRERKISIPLYIDSNLVLVAPKKVKVKDFYKKEKVIFSSDIPHAIEFFEEKREYDSKQLEVLSEVLSNLEEKVKAYKTPLDVDSIKRSVAGLVEVVKPERKVMFTKGTGIIEKIKKCFKKHDLNVAHI